MAGMILLVALGVLFLFLIKIYNDLVRMRNLIKNSFSQIDVQLKRRYDLIPNLVEAVKGYMKHERETLESVLAARNSAVSAIKALEQNPVNTELMQNLLKAEGTLGMSLGKLHVVVEAYPELKADRNMGQLMEELASTENKISFARQAFNDAVMAYNNLREVFPNSFVAQAFNFQSAQSFEIENAKEKEPVKVIFN